MAILTSSYLHHLMRHYLINFIDDPKQTLHRLIVQVKGGSVKSGDIRDLKGTMDREGAGLGVFITLEEPTREMATEAVSAGFYHSPIWHKDYPRIQILTIEQLLSGKQVEMPPQHGTFKQAPRFDKPDTSQSPLGI
jgi:site-specific DNA-methyltransferase (adenine-specific)